MAIKKNLQSAAAAMGRKGGKAKVPKGFAMRTPEELAELGRTGAAIRWGKPCPSCGVSGLDDCCTAKARKVPQ